MVAGPIRNVAHRIVLISRRDTVRVTTAASNLLGTDAIARRARSSRSGISNHFVFDYRTYSWLHYFGFCACSSTICDCNWALTVSASPLYRASAMLRWFDTQSSWSEPK